MTFFSAKTAGVALLISYSASMSVSCFAFAETTLSSIWLDQQINKHPDIVSARELMNAEFSTAQGSKLPLYNPELSTDYTRNGDNNDYSVGVEQTIDLWDRQGARRQKAGFMRTAAQAQYQEVFLNISADDRRIFKLK